MTNEEFQNLALEELKSIKSDINGLKEGQNRIEKKLDNIIEDNKSIHEMLGEHEISIRTLRRKSGLVES